MEEHLVLVVGDVIKIKRGAMLFLPEETPLRVIRILEDEQYELDWPGKVARHSVLMQYGADRYAKKLLPAEQEGKA